MKKVFSMFFVLSILLLCAAPIFSFAFYSNDPVIVDSDLQRPVPEIIVNGNQTTYIQYYVRQGFNSTVPNTSLFKVVFTIPSSDNVIFRLDSYMQTCILTNSSSSFLFSQYEYNISDGTLINQSTGYSDSEFLISGYTQRVGFRAGYFPIYSMYSNHDAFGFPITNLNTTSSTAGSNSYHVWNTNANDFVNWTVPHSDIVIRSKIPQPLSDLRHMYFADKDYLFQVNIAYPTLYQSTGLNGSVVNGVQLTADIFFDQCYIELQKRDISHVNLNIINRTDQVFNVYISKYDVVSGEFISQSNHSILAIDNNGNPQVETIPIEISEANTSGLWYTGFVNTDGLDAFDKLKISWSDTIDYSTDFEAINTFLGLIENDLISVNTSLTSINTVLSNVYDLIFDNYTWLQTTFYDNINNRWSISNNYLLAIFNLLNESEETVSIEDDTSGVAAMESAKNDLVVTNSAGQTVDAGEAAAAGLSEAAQQIGEIAQPVSTINQLMQTIVFDKPKLLLPVIVALGLGLMVTILGKNKSD